MTLDPGPCQDWLVPEDLEDECRTIDNIERWIEVASALLFKLTGRKYTGHCSESVRPECRRHCGSPCGCWLSEITLGGYPLVSIDEVLVDGVALDASLYTISNHKTLVRLPDPDGARRSWPSYQRMDLDPTEPQTFEVSYTFGREPPPDGVLAAAELACELAKAKQGDDSCRLPKRVTSVVRQGVSFQMIDSFRFFERGRTGLYLVDAFISSENPSGSARPAAVMSPDIGPPVRRFPGPSGS